MKKLTSALLLSASLSILSVPVFAHSSNTVANGTWRNNEKMITIPVTATKKDAYTNAYKKLQMIKKKKGAELRKELQMFVTSPSLDKSLDLDHMFVTVKEYMNESGKLMYQGTVNVQFHYQEKASNN